MKRYIRWCTKFFRLMAVFGILFVLMFGETKPTIYHYEIFKEKRSKMDDAFGLRTDVDGLLR